MVPENHFLRAIEATINFTFIKKQLTTYYCKDSGRLSIHPIVLFKVISIEYCQGICSECQLTKEIQNNMAYR